MSNNTTKLVTGTRLRQLLDCYGSDSLSWPEDERHAALSLLKGSHELKAYREEVHEIDQLLATLKAQEINSLHRPDVLSLQQRILDQLPEQDPVDRYDNTGADTRRGRSRFWMGSIAASLFIISLSAGVTYTLFNPDQAAQQTISVANHDPELGLQNEFARWAWEDITDESLAIDTDSDPTTLLALVELELPAE